MRWCTQALKIKPFEDYVGSDPVLLYVGIRADENRAGYLGSGGTSGKPVVISDQSNITPE